MRSSMKVRSTSQRDHEALLSRELCAIISHRSVVYFALSGSLLHASKDRLASWIEVRRIDLVHVSEMCKRVRCRSFLAVMFEIPHLVQVADENFHRPPART